MSKGIEFDPSELSSKPLEFDGFKVVKFDHLTV